MVLRAGSTLEDIAARSPSWGKFDRKAKSNACGNRQISLGICDFSAARLPRRHYRRAGLCLQIFELGERSVDGEIAIVDEELAAHTIGIEPEIDLIAWCQISTLRFEIADRHRPGDEV